MVDATILCDKLYLSCLQNQHGLDLLCDFQFKHLFACTNTVWV